MLRTPRVALTAAFIAALAACGGNSEPTETIALRDTAAGRMGSLASANGAQAGKLDARLRKASGKVDVWVTLEAPSVAAFKTARLVTMGRDMQVRSADAEGRQRILAGTDQQVQASDVRAHRQAVRLQQDSAMSRMQSLGVTELGRVQIAHNAVAVTVDAASLPALTQMPGVVKIRPVIHYEVMLSETVPYVGAASVQATGKDGTGVRVAVFDSGIDYTHRNLGGSGSAADYATATENPAVVPAGLFPTVKVVGGYDFTGSAWPTNGPRSEDPNPIDDGAGGGHGTHVADIIGGRSLDGTHKGVAPGAQLLAVKVCSSVSTSCNGVALLKGVDYALDPNGDGDISDAVDVINLSLGSSYGQIEDDLTNALQNAVDLGVVVVAAAGNSGNLPYVVSTPSVGAGVISVAQTQVPSAKVYPLTINAPAAIAGTVRNTNTVDWAPIGSGFSGEVKLAGTAAGTATHLACAAFPAGSLAGKVAYIDRGTCSISVKVDFAARAGAIGVLLANNAPGDPPSFSFGGPTPFMAAQTMVITQADGARIKANAAAPVTVTVSPANAISLAGSMASTSARGPFMSNSAIKPEIGAPGASVSADYGSGSGQSAFGGTSGATPMVAGAAALLIQAYPGRSPLVIKAMLMNSAETQVYTNPLALPGELAPITRIGAGELRVNRAMALETAAWNRQSQSASLSYGALEVATPRLVSATLRVKNFGNHDKWYSVRSSFRYADDEASGAVRVLTKPVVRVSAGGHEDLDVLLWIDPRKLPDWTLNGGSRGGDGAALNGPEFDGYITLTAGDEKVSVPWHVLPRKAAQTVASLVGNASNQKVKLLNLGWNDGEYEVFSLVGESPAIPNSEFPVPGDNIAVIDLRAVGARYLAEEQCGVAGGCLEFAINSLRRRAHPAYPGGFEVDVDTNGDGIPDYFIFNQESGTFASSGRTLISVQNAATGAVAAYFYADADLNSGNIIMTVPLGALGVTAGTTLGFDVLAYDNYFTGIVSDAIVGMKFTPGNARFGVSGDPWGSTAAWRFTQLPVVRGTVADAASTELGLLMMYRRDAGNEASAVRIN